MTPIPAGARSRAALITTLALLTLAALSTLPAARASAAAGGLSATASSIPYESEEPSPEAAETAPTESEGVAGNRALLVTGKAVAPLAAPPAVKAAIQAANRIRAKPYIWGGGHGHWWDAGYDCSGAVSYMLHGGGLLNTPMVSGSLARWGAPGPGRWITIYANAGHVFATVAGLSWDTVGDTRGTGPRWHRVPESPAGFVVRHPVGY